MIVCMVVTGVKYLDAVDRNSVQDEMSHRYWPGCFVTEDSKSDLPQLATCTSNRDTLQNHSKLGSNRTRAVHSCEAISRQIWRFSSSGCSNPDLSRSVNLSM